MVTPAVEVSRLRKTYSVPVREPGVMASLRSLVRRTTRDVHAVDDLSIVVNPGEVTGFLGPNGAGKTTTLKMLSGLLYPTGGHVRVLGYEPSRRDRAFLRQITLVMGQRNQLAWDIPATDSFELHRAIYRVPGQTTDALSTNSLTSWTLSHCSPSPSANSPSASA